MFSHVLFRCEIYMYQIFQSSKIQEVCVFFLASYFFLTRLKDALWRLKCLSKDTFPFFSAINKKERTDRTKVQSWKSVHVWFTSLVQFLCCFHCATCFLSKCCSLMNARIVPSFGVNKNFCPNFVRFCFRIAELNFILHEFWALLFSRAEKNAAGEKKKTLGKFCGNACAHLLTPRNSIATRTNYRPSPSLSPLSHW